MAESLEIRNRGHKCPHKKNLGPTTAVKKQNKVDTSLKYAFTLLCFVTNSNKKKKVESLMTPLTDICVNS